MASLGLGLAAKAEILEPDGPGALKSNTWKRGNDSNLYSLMRALSGARKYRQSRDPGARRTAIIDLEAGDRFESPLRIQQGALILMHWNLRFGNGA